MIGLSPTVFLVLLPRTTTILTANKMSQWAKQESILVNFIYWQIFTVCVRKLCICDTLLSVILVSFFTQFVCHIKWPCIYGFMAPYRCLIQTLRTLLSGPNQLGFISWMVFLSFLIIYLAHKLRLLVYSYLVQSCVDHCSTVLAGLPVSSLTPSMQPSIAAVYWAAQTFICCVCVVCVNCAALTPNSSYSNCVS